MDKAKEYLKEYAIIAWNFLKEKFKRFWVALRRVWKKYHVTKVAILLFLTTSLILTVFLTITARQTNVERLHVGLEQTTTIIDEQGEEAGSMYSQKGTYTPIENISEVVQEAVISTEDRRFYSHRGFDVMGIGRAAVGLVTQRRIVGGGSTLTQQLAKNAYLSADQTASRKLRELFLAIEIEKAYSKDDILEMYLNNSYFGQGVWGVQDASKKYFNKNASELNVSEAAMMAAILKAPSNYNPIDNYDKAIERRNIVLSAMADNEVISEEERQQAATSDLALSDGYQDNDDYRFPYYFDAVIAEAINQYGFTEQDILNGGYTIYTSLNQNQQQQMDSVYGNNSLFETADDGVGAQSASIALNPQTGGVTAVVGGRNDHTFRGFNRATQMRRQPGSIIKPLSVYAPALEAGYEIDDILIDEEHTYGEGEAAYTPSNFDGQFAGEIPMYQALAESKNGATVWLLDQIGVRRGYNKLKDFGIPVSEKDYHLGGIALGGMDRGVTPFEMARAYMVFANDGVRIEPYFIQKIVDPTGAIVVDNSNPKEKRVLSQAVNDDMNRMLLNVFTNGSGQRVKPAGYDVAGKTGTTQTTSGTGATDQWLVAYTPDMVIASWQGYDEASEGHYLESYTADGIGQVVKQEFEAMLPYTQGTQFAVDDGDIEVASQDETENEMREFFEEGLKKSGRVIRDTTEKAVDGAKKVADEAEKLLRSFLNR